MNLRTDYKYALVEEYKTYWDAFQEPQEFYSRLISISEDVSTHFRLRKDVVRAVSYTHLRAHETPEHLVWRVLL